MKGCRGCSAPVRWYDQQGTIHGLRNSGKHGTNHKSSSSHTRLESSATASSASAGSRGSLTKEGLYGVAMGGKEASEGSMFFKCDAGTVSVLP
jgi:hypothetical protein